ncbi:unnamed protein product [Protopolystoma xenopodis]|uniref:Uncharacterized protein n=1 Tax=Protopolystoma xenopodis TaxID=117903 RepID=A0A3S5AMN2_9PLAT|nr:unnamed protein product [Protopolystoma xenopodis]
MAMTNLLTSEQCNARGSLTNSLLPYAHHPTHMSNGGSVVIVTPTTSSCSSLALTNTPSNFELNTSTCSVSERSYSHSSGGVEGNEEGSRGTLGEIVIQMVPTDAAAVKGSQNDQHHSESILGLILHAVDVENTVEVGNRRITNEDEGEEEEEEWEEEAIEGVDDDEDLEEDDVDKSTTTSVDLSESCCLAGGEEFADSSFGLNLSASFRRLYHRLFDSIPEEMEEPDSTCK